LSGCSIGFRFIRLATRDFFTAPVKEQGQRRS